MEDKDKEIEKLNKKIKALEDYLGVRIIHKPEEISIEKIEPPADPDPYVS